jgi:hypothetical protein
LNLESWILDLGKNAFWMPSLQNPRSKIQVSHKTWKNAIFDHQKMP